MPRDGRTGTNAEVSLLPPAPPPPPWCPWAIIPLAARWCWYTNCASYPPPPPVLDADDVRPPDDPLSEGDDDVLDVVCRNWSIRDERVIDMARSSIDVLSVGILCSLYYFTVSETIKYLDKYNDFNLYVLCIWNFNCSCSPFRFSDALRFCQSFHSLVLKKENMSSISLSQTIINLLSPHRYTFTQLDLMASTWCWWGGGLYIRTATWRILSSIHSVGRTVARAFGRVIKILFSIQGNVMLYVHHSPLCNASIQRT